MHFHLVLFGTSRFVKKPKLTQVKNHMERPSVDVLADSPAEVPACSWYEVGTEDWETELAVGQLLGKKLRTEP